MNTKIQPLKRGDILDIRGRRWFSRTHGNTYHSVVVRINGDAVYSSGKHYGYGSAWEDTAADWLRRNGYTDHDGPMWQLRDDLGVKYLTEVNDVSRERDL